MACGNNDGNGQVVVVAVLLAVIRTTGLSDGNIIAIGALLATVGIGMITGSVWIAYRIGQLENAVHDIRKDISGIWTQLGRHRRVIEPHVPEIDPTETEHVL